MEEKLPAGTGSAGSRQKGGKVSGGGELSGGEGNLWGSWGREQLAREEGG